MNKYLNKRNETTVTKLVQDCATKARFQSIARQEGREAVIKDCAKSLKVNVNTMRAVAWCW